MKTINWKQILQGVPDTLVVSSNFVVVIFVVGELKPFFATQKSLKFSLTSDLQFYSILTLCIAPLLLIVDIILLTITLKFYRYYHDWRVARESGGETMAYASRIVDPSLPQTQTINVDN